MTKKQIIEKTKYWVKILCLDGEDIDIQFVKFDQKELDEAKQGNWELQAVADFNSTYREGSVKFNLEKLKGIDEEHIVHELLHIKIAELTGYIYANLGEEKGDKWKGYFEERFVSQMAKIITRL